MNNRIDEVYQSMCKEQKSLPQERNGRKLKKADMHAHTAYSREFLPGGKNTASGWYRAVNFFVYFLARYRRLFFQKDFTMPNLQNYELYYNLPYSPKKVFDNAISKGMDFVPITDHNTIEGALDLIKKYPSSKKKVIIGEELTCKLKKRGYEIHVGVYDINKSEHEELQARKNSALKVVKYLNREGKTFALNHLTAYNWDQIRAISQEEIKRLIKLFDVFEVRNGIMGKEHNQICEILANVYSKGKIAGTDSHSLRGGKTYTAAYASTKEEFLEQIRKKRSYVFGKHGSLKMYQQEILDKTSNYMDIYIDGQRAFNHRTRFRDFAFRKLGKFTAGRLTKFVGVQLEKQNLEQTYKFLEEKLSNC